MSPWLHEGDAPQPGGRKPLLAQARRVAARWLSRLSEHAFIAPDAVWHYGAASAGLPRAPQPFADLPAWLAAHAGCSVHAVLSSRCSKSLLLDAGADGVAADDSTGLGTLARARLMQVWGDAAVDWPLRTWSGRRRHGACAWADAQAVRWLADAQEAGVRVRSLQPWWSVALGRVIAEQPQWGRDERSALLVCEAEHATWLVGSDGELTVLAQRRLEDASLAALAACAAECSAADAVAAERVAIIGYGLRTHAGARFAGEQVLVTLDAPTPEAAWLAH